MNVNSNLFEGYIAASPFPLNEKLPKVDSILSKKQNFDRFLFFTSGSDEGVVKEGTKNLNKILKNKAPKTMNWIFRELEGEQHRSTPFTTLYHGIINYYLNHQELQFISLEEFKKAGGLSYVYDYYEKRANRFGFSSDLTIWTMFSLTRNAIRANHYVQFDSFVKEFEKTDFLSELRVGRACLIAEFYLQNKQYNRAKSLFLYLNNKHPTSNL